MPGDLLQKTCQTASQLGIGYRESAIKKIQKMRSPDASFSFLSSIPNPESRIPKPTPWGFVLMERGPCGRSVPMLNVGLTGGIATGKSTVVRMLVGKGARVIDHDGLVHALQEPGQPVWKRIVEAFGRDILDADERIDRKKLGALVFVDQSTTYSPKRRRKTYSLMEMKRAA